MSDNNEAPADRQSLPLFPLQTVFFPGSLLPLKIFEARYLDMVSDCLRRDAPFGIVALLRGTEVRHSEEALQLAPVGVCAELLDVDSPAAGILLVRCQGTQRFRIEAAQQDADGLWRAEVELLDEDVAVPLPADAAPVAEALQSALDSLRQQGAEPFMAPLRFDDAGWVADRWSELLPLPLPAKQQLLELRDANERLAQVTQLLRQYKVVD